jgi:hypothetical protein
LFKKDITMKQQRIYIVGHGQSIRLVRAAHRSQALSHVARSIINVKVANQDELVEALTKGITVETASNDQDTKDVFAEDQQTEQAA